MKEKVKIRGWAQSQKEERNVTVIHRRHTMGRARREEEGKTFIT